MPMSTVPQEEIAGGTALAPPSSIEAGTGPAYEDFFSYRLVLLMKLTERRTAERVYAATQLTLSEGRAVMIVAAHQPIRVQDIASRSHLDKSQASRVAESLLERGLVRKAGSQTDRRAASITLTDEGQRVNDLLLSITRQRNQEMLRRLTVTQRRRLIEQLDRLIEDAGH